MAYFCKDILINDICSILSMINIGYEQNIAILLPIIVTLNTVFVSGFIDLDSTAMIISNSINLCEERRTKSSRLGYTYL